MAKKMKIKKKKPVNKVCSIAGSKLSKHGYKSSGATLGSSICKD